jgi:hypothetical protein
MDEFTGKIAASFITEIFKDALQGVHELSRFASNQASSHDLLGTVAHKYAANAFERFNTMKIFGMTDPMPLTDIYTRVHVLRTLPRNQRRSADDLQYEFEMRQRRRVASDATRPGIDVVNEISRIVLLGKPGAGKTTFLRRVLLQCLDGELAEKRFPILVSLHAAANSTKSVSDLLEAELSLAEMSDPRPFLQHLLQKGKCLLLFDGLDEVPEAKRSDIISEIAQFAETYRRNRYIVSCRTAVYSYFFERFTEVEMADFSPENVREFIFSWFTGDQQIALECWKELCAQPNIMELASVPLLLTMICLAYDETRTLSNNRAEVYKEAIDALLKKWDNSRNRIRDEPYRQLTFRRKEDLFNIVAASTFEKDQFFMKEDELKTMIAEYLERLQLLETLDEHVIDAASRVLSAIEGNHGIFLQCATRVWSFAHLTFQEYFTANYILLKGEESRQSLVKEYLEQPKWREVFILVANLLPDADEFVTSMLEKMTEIGFPRSPIAGLRANITARNRKGSHVFVERSRQHLYVLDTASQKAIDKEMGQVPRLGDVERAIVEARRNLRLGAVLSKAGVEMLGEIAFQLHLAEGPARSDLQEIFRDFARAARDVTATNLGAEDMKWLGRINRRANAGDDGRWSESKEDYVSMFADFVTYVEQRAGKELAISERRSMLDTLEQYIDRELRSTRSFQTVRALYVAEMLLEIVRSPARLHIEVRRAALRMIYSVNPSGGPGGYPADERPAQQMRLRA